MNQENKYYSAVISTDGFGAQYQKIIQTYIYCKNNNLEFVYRPLDLVEHNYDNDNNYNNILENLMNLKNNILNINEKMNVENIDFLSIVYPYFENNIDLCCDSEHLKFIKDNFWSNKERNYFKNNKYNVSIHIRRENLHDKGLAGVRITTPNSYYLNIMNEIRENNKDRDIIFHIYSQGNIENFKDLENSDVEFYLNSNIIETFTGLVGAEALVLSPSSFGYIAGLLSDGEIYYKNFWHNPRKNWHVYN